MRRKRKLVVWVNVRTDRKLFPRPAFLSYSDAMESEFPGVPTKFIEAPKRRKKKDKPEVVYGPGTVPKKRKPIVCRKCGAWGLHECKPKK